MMMVDWSAVVFGLAVGSGTSAAFFAGLGLGMRLAMRSGRPVVILMLSAVMRIAVLLGIGWAVVALSGPFALAGFAGAFLLTRTIATAIARSGAPAGGGR